LDFVQQLGICWPYFHSAEDLLAGLLQGEPGKSLAPVELRKLALRWEDYLTVREGTFETCAASVIAKFWVSLYFYEVPFIVHDPTVLTREFHSM
jgi:hypothetical protein